MHRHRERLHANEVLFGLARRIANRKIDGISFSAASDFGDTALTRFPRLPISLTANREARLGLATGSQGEKVDAR
jgi:hypothetical protein